MVGGHTLDRTLEEATNCLTLGENVRGMIRYLSVLQHGQDKREEFKEVIEKGLDFFNRAEIYQATLYEATVTGNIILNLAERNFFSSYLLNQDERLQRLRKISSEIKYGIQPSKEAIETLLTFYDEIQTFVLNRHQELLGPRIT
jgi:hypothetical protein